MKEIIEDVLVVKVGTNTLLEKLGDESERLDTESFRRIGRQVLALHDRGTQIILVTSGAITAGSVATGESRHGKSVPELQRLAAIGWRHILNAWADALEGATTSSVLLTQHELSLSNERTELLAVTHTMLSRGDIVIANENDAIAHEEIAFGDNDTLGATYAAHLRHLALFGKVGYVILSDVNGVYEDKNDASTLIRVIDDIDRYEYLAGGTMSANGTGGMKTKFMAGRIARAGGVPMWITHGRSDNAIAGAIAGELGTAFQRG